MNGLDVVLLLAVAAAVIGGWGMGFLRRLGGWIGAAIGIATGVLLTPEVVRWVNPRTDLTVLLVGGAVLIGLASLGQAAGAAIGARARSGVDTSSGRWIDSVGGAALGIVGIGVLAWLVLPVMSQTEGWPASSTRHSAIARALVDHLPKPPAQLTRLERELAGGQFPKMFTGLRPAPEVVDPPPEIDMSRSLLARARDSVVKVEGPACGRIQSGSGFFVAEGTIATNAHVVAGSNETAVITSDGRSHRARVIHFDPEADLALLRTSQSRPVLTLAEPAVAQEGLVMGFPGGGPFDPSPFSVAQQVDATGYDIYDRSLVTRDLLILSSNLQAGDSGSAVLRSDGSVIGVAVAIAPDRPGVAYALSSSELTRVMREADASAADTGACI